VSKPANDEVDRQRVKSPLARYLDEAFAGCDVWTVAPSRRRAAAGLVPPDWVSRGEPRGEPPAPLR
jgi:hypothetical protein